MAQCTTMKAADLTHLDERAVLTGWRAACGCPMSAHSLWCGADWDLGADGKRVAVVIPEGTAQAPQQEHEILMLLNFADELRRRVPLGK
jgi:hypothetical protein